LDYYRSGCRGGRFDRNIIDSHSDKKMPSLCLPDPHGLTQVIAAVFY